jgi:AcrR family transcriptional regulator
VALPQSNLGRRRASARGKASESYLTKRSGIIAAAAQIFEEKGYEATSFQDIADEVGIDRSSLYYYIPNKEQLFRDVVYGAVREGVATLDAVMEADISASEKLRLVVGSLMSAYAENYPYMSVWVREDLGRVLRSSEGSDKRDELVELAQRYRIAVESILADGIRDGEFRELDETGIVALGLLGMINWSHRWFNPRGALGADRVAQIFWDVLLKGLLR